MKSILNIAAYLFVSLDDLPELRAKMLDECNSRHLKGTIPVSYTHLTLPTIYSV